MLKLDSTEDTIAHLTAIHASRWRTSELRTRHQKVCSSRRKTPPLTHIQTISVTSCLGINSVQYLTYNLTLMQKSLPLRYLYMEPVTHVPFNTTRWPPTTGKL